MFFTACSEDESRVLNVINESLYQHNYIENREKIIEIKTNLKDILNSSTLKAMVDFVDFAGLCMGHFGHFPSQLFIH